MKIICSWCKRFLGEKEPFDDLSETHAKCVDCLKKQAEENKRLPHKTNDLGLEETPSEMAARVHQVISILAEGVLNLIHERSKGGKNDTPSGLKEQKKGKSAKS